MVRSVATMSYPQRLVLKEGVRLMFHRHVMLVIVVNGSSKCKTCHHFVEASTFTSNVTRRTYSVSSPEGCMNCGTMSVTYLITCKKFGVQYASIYVGETIQTLRCRFSNHRNRLKQLCGLYLYHHFNSHCHTLEDIGIMPIEEVVSEPSDTISLACKRLKREDFWYRELAMHHLSIWLKWYIRGLGNVSSKKDKGLVVYGLINKSRRKFRKRKPHRHRKRIGSRSVEELMANLVVDYKTPSFTFRLKSYVMRLPKYKVRVAADVIYRLVVSEHIPNRILLLVNDLMSHKFRVVTASKVESMITDIKRSYLNVLFHNKGMDKIDLPRILNSKRVMSALPKHLSGLPL